MITMPPWPGAALGIQPKTATSDILASADILYISTAVLSFLSPLRLDVARENVMFTDDLRRRVVN
jgi:hypothetical protein